jgi:hypothetical protein
MFDKDLIKERYMVDKVLFVWMKPL